MIGDRTSPPCLEREKALAALVHRPESVTEITKHVGRLVLEQHARCSLGDVKNRVALQESEAEAVHGAGYDLICAGHPEVL